MHFFTGNWVKSSVALRAQGIFFADFFDDPESGGIFIDFLVEKDSPSAIIK